MNRHFFKEDIQMVNRHMKRCSKSLIIQEMQIKSTMRKYLTLVRRTINNKSTNNTCWHALLVGMQTGISTMENSVEVPQKIKIELPYDLPIQLLGIYLKKSETLIQKDMFLCSLQHS